MTLHIGVLIASFVLVASSSVLTEPTKERGGCIGVSIGATMLDDGKALGFFNQDDSISGSCVLGGIKLLPPLSVEGRYIDLGTIYVGAPPFDASVSSRHAVRIDPLGSSSWEFIGQPGLGRWMSSSPTLRREPRLSNPPGLQFVFPRTRPSRSRGTSMHIPGEEYLCVSRGRFVSVRRHSSPSKFSDWGNTQGEEYV